ncbi:hypothetical protein Tcan_09954 [Toxocara canis]|uniref:Uncharacterized protein n=1 Tax=Toxocara canis TaxID=6265 RepID=A0A0B2V5V1_TOXCA|nr:hypothetical protein Tcan_09954 [Toxocara canis]
MFEDSNEPFNGNISDGRKIMTEISILVVGSRAQHKIVELLLMADYSQFSLITETETLNNFTVPCYTNEDCKVAQYEKICSKGCCMDLIL